MPQLLVFGVGVVAGLWAGDGLEAGGRLLRWGVIGGAGFLAAKHLKVI